MFCSYCGKNIDDNETVCPSCGTRQCSIARQNNLHNKSLKNKTMRAKIMEDVSSAPFAIIGFVFAFILPFLGLIFSIMGLKSRDNGLAITGIAISTITLILPIIGIIIYAAMQL